MLSGIYSAIYGGVNVSVEKCVEIKGGYVEKQQSCFISATLKSWSGRKLLGSTAYVLYLKMILGGLKVTRFGRNTAVKQTVMLQIGFC